MQHFLSSMLRQNFLGNPSFVWKILQIWENISKIFVSGVYWNYNIAYLQLSCNVTFNVINVLMNSVIAVIICPSLLVLIFDILKSNILDILFPLNYTCQRTFPLMMEYFVDQQKYFYPIAAHIIIVNIFGAIILLSTEVSAMTLVQHICGLYKILRWVDITIIITVIECSMKY